MRILTWNISLTDPSFSAPPDWDRNQNIFEIQKVIEDEDPDFFTLQEMPSTNFGKRFVDYHLIDPVQSHSGVVGVFIKKKFKIHRVVSISPCVASEISDQESENGKGDIRIIFGGCHLFPFKPNANIRLDQISDLLDKIGELSNETPIFIAGDMNMREAETRDMLTSFNFKDAYFSSEKSKEKKYTWDSRVNIYHENAFQFVARFDRIFFRNAKLQSFKLIGNKPVSENLNHFVSDHYGISIEISL